MLQQKKVSETQGGAHSPMVPGISCQKAAGWLRAQSLEPGSRLLVRTLVLPCVSCLTLDRLFNLSLLVSSSVKWVTVPI